ncbi:MAG TPA: hypothetical protein VJH65_02195 [Candidatus Nanoarchaeia archaeon]|nr:hypothetical protein [Candidatus Nanoarchaeia archaeon]
MFTHTHGIGYQSLKKAFDKRRIGPNDEIITNNEWPLYFKEDGSLYRLKKYLDGSKERIDLKENYLEKIGKWAGIDLKYHPREKSLVNPREK